MPDLVVTGHITRTELGLGNLALNDDTYKIIRGGFGPGEVTWRRQYAQSPFSPGRYLVNAQKDQGALNLAVRVTGSSEDNCLAAMATLVAAMEQFEYDLSMTIGTTTYTYTCEPADYSIGEAGQFQNFHLMAWKQELTAVVPRFPTPVAGAF